MTAYSLGRLSLLAALLHAGVGHAQVSTNITSSGLRTQIGAPQANALGGSTYDITGGTRNGLTLFHSLGSFSVGTNDGANFKNDTGAATSNILGRITGGAVSNIDGMISTTGFPNANLYLINPAGWIFGPNATLQVEGSFHVSTAHYLLLEDVDKTRSRFAADTSPLPQLLQAPAPIAFGFLGPTAPIVIQGTPGLSLLSVPPGQTLSIVGGDIQMNGATLVAPSGHIQIGSFASAGEASVYGLKGAFSNLGRIELTGSTIDASAFDPINFIQLSTPAGSIMIRGGQLVMDSSGIGASNYGDIEGGVIDLSLAQSVSLKNQSTIGSTASADFGGGIGRGSDIHVTAPQIDLDGSFILTQTVGSGPAGNVSVEAGTLAIINGGAVGSIGMQGTGRSGDVNVVASDSITVSGRDSSSNPSSMYTQALDLGDGGQLTLSTPSLKMNNGGSIFTSSFSGQGGNLFLTVNSLSMDSAATINSHNSSGGNINVTATGPVTISGTASGIFSDTCPTCPNQAGNIFVQAKSINVSGGALIQSGSNINPQGGSMTLTGTDSVTISARSGVSTRAQDQNVGPVTISTPMLVLDNGYISASTLGTGHGGSIAVAVGTLTLTHGGQIASSTQLQATGSGGDIVVNASSASISGTSPTGVATTPFNTNASSGIFSTAHSSGNGNAGQITVTAPMLSMADGGTISAATSTGGAAGNVALNVGSLNMANGATVNSSTTSTGAGGAITLATSSASISGVGSGLFSTASKTGNAGQITLSGGSATVAGGARISTSTTGAGKAGTITANLGNMTVSGGGLDSSTSASGAGGAINVTASSEARVVNGGRISADSTGAGRTGNVTVTAGDRITMNGGSVSTRALTSDGGDITLKAPVIVRLENSQITTSVQSGHGAGGNVLIDPQFLVMNNSSITANAFGGPGGNITIIADNFLASSTALLQASSALSTPGSIQIVSPENNVAGSIAQLPRAFVDASRLLRGACSARREGAPSSFVLAGRGGVPAEADGYLPSTISAAPPAALALAYLDDCAR